MSEYMPVDRTSHSRNNTIDIEYGPDRPGPPHHKEFTTIEAAVKWAFNHQHDCDKIRSITLYDATAGRRVRLSAE
jgi:hypothetical protein